MPKKHKQRFAGTTDRDSSNLIDEQKALLAEPVRISPTQLCAKCQHGCNSWELTNRSLWKMLTFPHYETTRELRKSADEGCGICKQFISCAGPATDYNYQIWRSDHGMIRFLLTTFDMCELCWRSKDAEMSATTYLRVASGPCMYLILGDIIDNLINIEESYN